MQYNFREKLVTFFLQLGRIGASLLIVSLASAGIGVGVGFNEFFLWYFYF